jgi:hypothetical protein
MRSLRTRAGIPWTTDAYPSEPPQVYRASADITQARISAS